MSYFIALCHLLPGEIREAQSFMLQNLIFYFILFFNGLLYFFFILLHRRAEKGQVEFATHIKFGIFISQDSHWVLGLFIVKLLPTLTTKIDVERTKSDDCFKGRWLTGALKNFQFVTSVCTKWDFITNSECPTVIKNEFWMPYSTHTHILSRRFDIK